MSHDASLAKKVRVEDVELGGMRMLKGGQIGIEYLTLVLSCHHRLRWNGDLREGIAKNGRKMVCQKCEKKQQAATEEQSR